MAHQGMRGSNGYGNQRPGNFRGARVSREDIERNMKEVHRKVPKNVKKTGKKGKAKEKMLRAIGMSKARRGE